MKRLALSLAVLAATFPAAVLACEGKEHQAQAPKAVKSLTVAELASLQKAKQSQPIDANSAETRAKFGVIPGALLLTSVGSFDPAKELPSTKDSKLVFYCASTQCNASKQAAHKALEAGYTDVSILPEGIKGWKAAGQRTDSPRS